MNQPPEKDQSQIDPTQFQNLFDQMQNNHDFLEKMQGILGMYPMTTESDENNTTNTLQKTLTLNRLSSLNEELIRSQSQNSFNPHNTQQSLAQQPFIMQPLQRTETLQPTYTKETMEYTPTPHSNKFLQQTPISYQVDSQAKNLFQEQFCNTDLKNMFRQSINNEQQNQQNNFTSPGSENSNLMTPMSNTNLGGFMNNNQNMVGIDQFTPDISPEYFQMFNQFYQMFQQVQATTSIDMSNDPTFMQNMMVQYFTFMMQNGGMGQFNDQEGQTKSPRNFRDYNNLPLAAIPESKDSILEENSGWGTVQTNKLGLLLSNNSGIQKDQCNCCHNCQEMKKIGAYQQCSNFNPGIFQAFQNSQINQETFIQKSDISSAANSQILNNPFGLGSISPSPQRIYPQDIQNQYNSAQQLVNQNLNQVFQYNQLMQQQQNQIQDPSFNIHNQYDTRKNSYQSNVGELENYQNQAAYCQNQNIPQEQNQINLVSMNQVQLNRNELSPDNQQPNQNQILISPRQIQENKLIEYMIDNNDFSNYKQRRQVIKGERISRTLSRSNSKNNTMNWNHQHKLSIVSSNTNNNNTQRFSNQFQFSNINHNQNMYNYYSQNEEHLNTNHQQKQEFFSDYQNFKVDNYGSNDLIQAQDQKALMFFSPQVTNKQQCYVYKSTLEDVVSEDDNQQNFIRNFNHQEQEQENLSSPQNQNVDKGKIKKKKTQEKIQEIRRLNELQRGKEQLKKSVTRKNLHNQPQKNVFEIKDLKKSKSRKNAHYRKQSQNIISNKENNKLIQSNYQNNYELSEQQIILSPVQDPLLVSIEQEQQHKDIQTFKSLNSVANGRHRQSNNFNNYNQGDCASPQITNLKLKLDNQIKSTAAIIPFDNIENRLTSQKPSIDLNNILLDDSRKPGQEIHIIKKPVQTEEFKKIQERLNRYYQDKRKEEIVNNNEKQQNAHLQKANQQHYQQNDLEAMSMTKTLSSFKSLMMKTMSQMSIQQENNIAQQFLQGKDQRQRVNSRLQGIANNQNQSVNVSSIQDDYSVGVDYSENLTKIISPKNLYNGQLANIKKRNDKNTQDKQTIQEYQKYQNVDNQVQMQSKQQCLPNALFFKQQVTHNKQSSQDTLSLKYNSRPPSLCYCGQNDCICGQDSKKDLLSHFQNFLSEMDKHPKLNNQGLGIYKDSMFQSPIQNIRQSSSTNDFMFTNFNFPIPVRSSSQNSKLGALKGNHNQRQSSVSAVSSNIIIGGQPRMKRFSSGTTLTNLPLKKLQNNLNHCQSTHVFPHLKKISLDSDNQTNDIVIKQIKSIQQNSNNVSSSPSKLTGSSQDQLEKLDTNKEEEIRLLNIENDIMQKAFIQKSHRLNLQDNQRNELLQRIQLYKQGQQQVAGKNNSGVSSTIHEEGIYSQGAAGSTQNTSHVTGMGYGSNYNSGNLSINQQNQTRRMSDNCNLQIPNYGKSSLINNGTSLDERRKIEKYQKKADTILQNQNQREIDIKHHQQQQQYS